MVRFDLCTGQVRENGRLVSLAPRELALLYCLALERRVSKERLEALLWPDCAPTRNAVAVCVHRVRTRLQDARAIVNAPFGYALGEVETDLAELESLVAGLRSFGPLPQAMVARAMTGHAYLAARCAPSLSLEDVSSALERRACGLLRALAERLAAHAFRTERLDVALSLAEQMVESDVCDEDAWEIAIRAHLGRRNRAAAIRSYRDYQRALHEHLGLTPSAHIQRLLRDYGVAS